MSDVTIRRATEKDLDAIYEINLVAWNEMSMRYLLEQKYGQVFGPKPANVQMAETVLRSCKSDLSRVFVAEIDGKVVGFASYSIETERSVGTVGYNAVHPDYRGRGIGTALQQRVKQAFREEGMKFAHVSTLAHDFPAQRVYEKMGFEEYCRSVHYAMRL